MLNISLKYYHWLYLLVSEVLWQWFMIHKIKDISKYTSCANTHHEVTTFEVDWTIYNVKQHLKDEV